MTRNQRWPVISALGVVQIFAWGSSYYLMAVLAAPIEADTGWPLPWVVGTISAALACAGLVSPAVGRAIARFGGRPVLALGCSLLALGLAVVAAAPNLLCFYLGWCIMGLGMGAGLYDPAFATLGRLYGEGARRAITMLTLWGGFASTVCWPLSTWLLDLGGWRSTAASYAVILLLICLPLIFVMIPKEPPLTANLSPGARPVAELSRHERLCFRVMAALLVVAGVAATLIAVHLLTLLQAQGLSLLEAVAIGAMLGPAQVAARVVEMAGRGRHHPIWTMMIATGCIALGLVLMALDLQLPGLAIVLYGAGSGIFSIARGALPLAVFGAARYPVLMGRLARPSLLAQAAAPILGGMLIATLGAERTLSAVAALGVANLALSVLLWRLTRRRAGPRRRPQVCPHLAASWHGQPRAGRDSRETDSIRGRAMIQPTASFKENLSLLPSIEGVARIDLLDAAGAVVAVIENQPGKQGSLAVYQYLQQSFGSLSPAAAEHGVAIFAEHAEDARNRPGAHPNIDRLLEIMGGAAPLQIAVIAA